MRRGKRQKAKGNSKRIGGGSANCQKKEVSFPTPHTPHPTPSFKSGLLPNTYPPTPNNINHDREWL
ncbi:hypothetical protein O53_2401 [Microcystis aeruginosa TAIHU98]|uniref:Uncharacterized protein n=1 Tax=Microcystis aeruginosa TAIHU98 TaxID=1134457 RepID=L7E2E8_MICAE|nr:hypothetical protein O53_2401 [Microcystis aeruginosa TAIHU98]